MQTVSWKCLLGAALLFGSSCIDAKGTTKGITPRDVALSEGFRLEQACSPSGAEMCFDGVDNNCNGIIDEGCGLHTGVLQFVIAWDADEADVNLEVTDPKGETADSLEPTLAGLVKDRDCPKPTGECYGQNIENVYLAEREPEKGRYRVVVRLDRLGGASPPVRVRLGVRIGQRSYASSFDLSPGEKTSEKELEFTL